MKKVEIVAFDHTWHSKYKAVEDKLSKIFEEDLVEVCHIGSTAIEGMKAKPIIDVLVALNDQENIHKYHNQLSLDYTYKGHKGKSQRYFYFNDQVHIHVVTYQDQNYHKMRLFGNHLKLRPKKRQAYNQLKESLSDTYHDRGKYTEGKRSFIESCIEEEKLIEFMTCHMGQVTSYRPVTGGLLHKMYKLETLAGDYAVKVLNPKIMTKPHVFDNYKHAEAFTRLAVKEGIKALPALDIKGSIINEYLESHYQVFAWHEGTSGKELDISLNMCQQVGRTLAKIHQLAYDTDQVHNDLSFLDWYLVGEDLMTKDDQDLLKGLEEKTKLAINQLSFDTFSHRDLDPKNTLWSDGDLYVIDWEASGYTNHVVELLEAALSWSKNASQTSLFIGLIKAYQEIKPVEMNDLLTSLYGINAGRFNWLAYNIGLVRKSGQKSAIKQVTSTVVSLKAFDDQHEGLCELLKTLDKESKNGNES